MRMTKNRKLILRLLDEPIDTSKPPHSVGRLHYQLKNMVKSKREGYPELANAPSVNFINRTVNDLLNGGYLVVNRVKRKGKGLPYWEKEYQLAESVIIPPHNG